MLGNVSCLSKPLSDYKSDWLKYLIPLSQQITE